MIHFYLTVIIITQGAADFMRARRALLAVDPHHPAGFRQW